MEISHSRDFSTWSKPAAVAVIVTATSSGNEVLLIERPPTMIEHAGQIACPGGRFDARQDKTLWDTVRRETREEVGVGLSREMCLGTLEPVHIPPTDYTVEPYLFYVTEKPRLVSSGEVAAWHWVSLTELVTLEEWNDERPQYPLGWGLVWGATARIMHQLLVAPHQDWDRIRQ